VVSSLSTSLLVPPTVGESSRETWEMRQGPRWRRTRRALNRPACTVISARTASSMVPELHLSTGQVEENYAEAHVVGACHGSAGKGGDDRAGSLTMVM
jgi:hypothetical protein